MRAPHVALPGCLQQLVLQLTLTGNALGLRELACLVLLPLLDPAGAAAQA